MTDRITELEIKVAFTEDLVEQLNLTVFRQQQQIEMLELQLKALRQQMQAVPSGGEARNLADEIPPHY
ncbi:MAG TPA: SlyX family protein [Rhodocyclaceae bacterium]|jgi:SlyX protein|nr:SlyX family protein [Rhodocyclaceae bacterium]